MNAIFSIGVSLKRTPAFVYSTEMASGTKKLPNRLVDDFENIWPDKRCTDGIFIFLRYKLRYKISRN